MNHRELHAPIQSRPAVRRLASWAVCFVAAFTAAAASGQGTLKAITGGLESGTTLVTLPGLPSGTLAARECSTGCPIVRLQFDRDTRFYVGKDAVPYAKFRQAASKGDLRLMISYRLSDKTLTRLRLPAAVKE